MGRLPLSGLYENPEAEKIFCVDCQMETRCAKKGLPKVTAGNRAAFREYQRMKAFPRYMPSPFFNALEERLLAIEAEINLIAEEKRRSDAGRNQAVQ